MSGPASPPASDQSAIRFGLLTGLAAYTLWGVFPIYLKAVAFAPPLEILAHRIIWSVPFGALLIALRRQWPEVIKAATTPRVLLFLALSAVTITGNWGIYVWAVVNDRILEASLGYYINPLMYVAAGVVVLKEKLRPLQTVAVIIACIGVLVLTIGSRALPWVPVLLAALFTAYGFLRKTTPVGAMPGLFVETTILSPVALLFLFLTMGAGNSAFMNGNATNDVLLILAGPATVVPLVLFALAARRLQLSTLGFLQYIGPTLQFVMGLMYGEAFTRLHAVSFGLIWLALAVFSYDAFRTNRRLRHYANASTSRKTT